ncbi:integrase catalytic domain-containing protein [Trichonephila clavipes]|nr:integrase catalytic domain-containing protein [Trichonephila clavipes]
MSSNTCQLREREDERLTSAQKEKLNLLLESFQNVFEPEGEATNILEHHINMGNSPPISVPPYIMSPVKNCPGCIKYKAPNQKSSGLLQTPVPAQRFETLAIDLFGPYLRVKMLTQLNRDLKPRLAILVQDNHDCWSEKLPFIRFALNTAKCETAGQTAAFLNFGTELRTPSEVVNDIRVVIQNDNFVPEITPYLKKFAKFSTQIREVVEEQKDSRKLHADKKRKAAPTYQPGEDVFVASHPLSNVAQGKSGRPPKIPQTPGSRRDAIGTRGGGCNTWRFIARRGRPRIIYCDNGTNFRGAFNDLAKLDWHKISRETSTQKNSLNLYHPPPHGGEAVICDCEFLINSRPLTYISENPQELIPLTPAMFLIENRCSDTTDIDELNSTDLRKRMKYRIKLLSDLRQRFRKEYLSELIQKQNDNRVREPRIGEMVLIGNDNKKRLSWPIAKIIELIPGRDGEIQTVRLKTQHGTVIRPVQRIFPLEVQAIANSDKELKEESISVKSTKPDKVLNINDAIIKIYFFWKIGYRTEERLDLLNYNCYRFETLPKSQRGGVCCKWK